VIRFDLGAGGAGAVAALMGFAAGYWLFLLPAYWRGEPAGRELRGFGWSRASALPQDVYDASHRALPTIVLSAFAFLLAFLSAVWGEATGYELKYSPWWVKAWTIGSVFLLAVVSPLWWYGVVYYNRPRWLVAPAYRNEPGVVQVRHRNGELAGYRRRARIRVMVILFLALILVAAIAARM